MKQTLLALSALLYLTSLASAATPAAGTVTATGPTLPFTGTFTGTATGTGAADPTVTIPGFNKDTFHLTVAGNASDYAGKLIQVKINWTIPADDYDLQINKRNPDGSDGDEIGTSGTGAPSTQEQFSINPVLPGEYNINVTYFTNAVPNTDQPVGTISVLTGTTIRTATYQHGGITFSPNSPTKAGTASSDGEPSSRIDNLGNYYISGIRGVPAGVDLWYFDLRQIAGVAGRAAKAGERKAPVGDGSVSSNPNYDPFMRVPIYRGQPDSLFDTTLQSQLSAGSLGGGDIDLAVGFGGYTGPLGLPGQAQEAGVPVLAYSSLTAANLTLGTSLDRGKTFAFNPAGNIIGGVPINDREWLGFFNNNIIYQVYRNFAQGIAFIQQSTNGGFSYGPALPPGGVTFPQTGSLEVDRTDGTVYVSSNAGQVAVGIPANNLPPLNTPTDAPQAYTVHQAVPTTVDSANIFFPIRVANDHTVYGAYSDGRSIFLVHSTDHGTTWTSPVQVSDPNLVGTDETGKLNPKVNLMPWLITGSTPGSVGVAWYGTDNDNNDDNARWRLFFAQTFTATAAAPAFRIVQASDHSIHASNISLKGLPLTGPSPNRNLIDYFQVSVDPLGAVIIGYTDDHNDFSGHTFVMRQVSGPSLNGGGSLPTQVEGSSLPAQPFAIPGTVGPTVGGKSPQPMQPGLNGEQVTDFAQDQDSGLLAVTPSNSAADILTIKYLSQDSNNGPVITATMTVSDLATVPPSGAWRMYFAANAPETGIVNISGNSYSKGLSDDADQFYVEAVTDAAGTRTANWGTAVRTFGGGIALTPRGSADRAFFNSQNRTISVRISSSKLNTYLAGLGHPTIGFGTVFCGLRGETSIAATPGVSTAALEDSTRGGTEFTIANP